MYRLRFLIVPAAALLCACSTSDVLLTHQVDLSRMEQPAPEEDLLDVVIRLFDPGVPEGEIDEEVLTDLRTEGIYPHIRRTESIQMAVQLRKAMQRSGHWGSVWISPRESLAADVSVSASILHSDGYLAQLHVEVIDVVGRIWIDERYELETPAGAYDTEHHPGLDPYQDLFNSVANDIAVAAAGLSPGDVDEIKTVGALRYAAELSAEAFGGYVIETRGLYAPRRLPATDDPMLERTQLVRQRERLFLETLDQHYEAMEREARPPYDGWREHAREESLAIREMTRSARWRTGLGVAALLASIAYGSGADVGSYVDRFMRDGMFLLGAEMLNMRTQTLRGRELHSQALEELSESFDGAIEPMIVEVAGIQHRLTGTAEAQYAELRELLRSLVISERGLVRETASSHGGP